jgi:hypothetical protein
MSPKVSDAPTRRAAAQQAAMTHQTAGREQTKNEPFSSQRGEQEVARWPGGLFLVGIHGGAGVTTLAQAGVGHDAGRRWPASPVPGFGAPHPLKGPTVPLPVGMPPNPRGLQGLPPGGVLLVVRETAAGLAAASGAAEVVANGKEIPAWLTMLGLVVVAAGPGRPARLVRERLPLVSGWFPRTWCVPWIAELLALDVDQVRYCTPLKAAIPPSLYKLQDLERN